MNLPEFPAVPKIRGRILIGGSIQDSGYEMREVRSSCFLPNGKPGTLLGETPDIGIGANSWRL